MNYVTGYLGSLLRSLALIPLASLPASVLAETSGAQVTTKFSGLVYDRATQTFNSVMTLTNNGPTIYAPLSVGVTTGSSAVSVKGATNGRTTFGTLPNGSLLPNESETFVISFVNPSRVPFTPTVSQVTGAAVPAGLGITITSPTAGQTPLGPSFLVIGRLATSRVAGASVDSVGACLSGTTFFVNGFTPRYSPTSFSAAANDIDGGQVTTSLAITPSKKGLTVLPSPICGGIEPLTTALSVSLETSDGDSITGLTVDFGTGEGPTPVLLGSPILNVYSTAGLYTVTVTATTALGVTLSQSALIAVQNASQAFAPVLASVSALQSALGSNDVVRALTYHTSTAQQRYAPLLGQSGINLLGLAALLGTAEPLVQVGNYSEVIVTSRDASSPQTSSVVLVRDGAGIWRIDSW